MNGCINKDSNADNSMITEFKNITQVENEVRTSWTFLILLQFQ